MNKLTIAPEDFFGYNKIYPELKTSKKFCICKLPEIMTTGKIPYKYVKGVKIFKEIHICNKCGETLFELDMKHKKQHDK